MEERKREKKRERERERTKKRKKEKEKKKLRKKRKRFLKNEILKHFRFDVTRVTFTVPLREHFSLPFIFLQFYTTGAYLRNLNINTFSYSNKMHTSTEIEKYALVPPIHSKSLESIK